MAVCIVKRGNMRRNGREAVYKLLFSNNFNDAFDNEFKEIIFTEEKLTKEDREFAESLINLYNEHKAEIDGVITELAKGYKLERIYATDKCALQIAIIEMTYIKEIPYIVSISEAMELVRKYSTAESPNFVNGILAKVAELVAKG